MEGVSSAEIEFFDRALLPLGSGAFFVGCVLCFCGAAVLSGRSLPDITLKRLYLAFRLILMDQILLFGLILGH